MKKILSLCILVFAFCIFITACDEECTHVYYSTCDTTCNECGKTREATEEHNYYGDCDSKCHSCGQERAVTVEHSWKPITDNLTCTEREACEGCGAIRGEYIVHIWKPATCTLPKSCELCGATEGEALGHIPGNDDGSCTTPISCYTCGTVLTEAKPSHEPEADDNDCTTAVTCKHCPTVLTQAKPTHEANADDGDCTTAVTCKHCPAILTQAKPLHEANADDGDCTTAVICKYCPTVLTQAKPIHEANADDGDCTTAVTCKHCTTVLTQPNPIHEANADDGDCTTAVTCKHCTTVLTQAKPLHEANADDGDCTTAVTCKHCTTVLTVAKSAHEAGADDNDCTSPVICKNCAQPAVAAKSHDFTGEYESDNAGHWHICKNDACTVAEAKAEHSGGTQTCIGYKCEKCNTRYGEAKKNAHKFDASAGECILCGEDIAIDAVLMSCDELGNAVSARLSSGLTDIKINMAAEPEEAMFISMRNAFANSDIADGSVNLTITGAKVIPRAGFFNLEISINSAGNKLKSLTLTDAEVINAFAFSDCAYLEAIELPKAVTIGEAAFQRCALRTVTLPEAITIGGSSFENNSNLIKFSAPKAVELNYYPWAVDEDKTASLEVLELTAQGDFDISGLNLFASTKTELIDLVLNIDKTSQVTQNDDGTATWSIITIYGDSFTQTFKSIRFTCTDGTLNHSLEYRDIDADFHEESCQTCNKIYKEPHFFDENNKCVCGALIIESVTVTGALQGGWNNEENLDGTSEIIGAVNVGKQAWQAGDRLTVKFTSERYGANVATFIYGEGEWKLDSEVKFVYCEGDITTVTAVYSPSKTLGVDEYIIGKCEIVNGAIQIDFSDSIREYSRLRIAASPSQEFTVTVDKFKPSGGGNHSTFNYTLTADSDGNAYIYGTFAEGGKVTVKNKVNSGIIAEYSFNQPTEAGISYVLYLSPGYEYDEATNTYFVNNANGLQVWSDATRTDCTANLVLKADITFTGTSSNWTPVGNTTPYTGTVDGNGYTITGLNMTRAFQSIAGFIASIDNGGVIKNLTLHNVTAIGSTAGAIVAKVECSVEENGNPILIYNCHVTGDSRVEGDTAGGVIGKIWSYSPTYVIACTNAATVKVLNDNNDSGGTLGGGGVVGAAMGNDSSVTLIACSSSGAIEILSTWETAQGVGGICGTASTDVQIIACFSAVTVEYETQGYEPSALAKDGFGRKLNGAQATYCNIGDAASINSKVAEMNAAIEAYNQSASAGTECHYIWQAVSDGYPVTVEASE